MPPSNRRLIRSVTYLTVVAVMFPVSNHCDGSPTVRFEDDIRPILKARCYRCHGDKTQRAELNLKAAAGILRGGESGAIIDPGNPDESLLLEVIQSGAMPPEDEGEPLSSDQIDLIRLWIEQGAVLDAHAEIAETQLHQHDVLPILLLRCATCHGRQTQEAGLDLRSRTTMLAGGKSGPAIVPRDPDASLIVQKIRQEEMPPRSQLASHSVKPVDDSELNRLAKWIELGAPEVAVQPDVASTEPDPLVSDEDRAFWSFQPPQSPALPAVDGHGRGSIDTFVLNRLTTSALQASPEAPRHILIRRAYFDLIGLPPTPEQVESFVSDRRPNAYEQVIDHLLASPQYGERWGQFWLDLAGYSDSEGVQHSDPIRPHAYRYRDYVIQSFNADKTYNRFLLEQIAGDELADYENADISGQFYDNLVATGFLRMTSDGTFAGITGFVPNRLDVIDDQLHVLSSAVMGLSIRCARCHSHKFDPIPQRDYYRLVALLKPAMDEHDWLKPVTGGAGNEMGSYRYLPIVRSPEREQWEQQEARITELKAQLKQRSDDQEFKAATEKKIKQLEADRIPEPMIRALWDRGQPSPTYLLRRGDFRQSARLVGPGVPSVLTDGKTPFAPKPPWPGSTKTGNRLALAKWLTGPTHPLTARVMVNRIWKHHFARGIVATLDDFGRAGAQPSHPQLLDWLAIEFVRSGWSIKHIHRLIMTSATYRQSSDSSAEHEQLDPENRLLSRMPLQRMDAEALRDTLLSLSGQLDATPFGPADAVSARADGLVVSTAKSSGFRRSVYVLKRRTQRLTILDNFDRPAMSPNCIDRPTSIVAPQALYLLNNKMVHELSLSLADRLLLESTDDEQRIRHLFLSAIGRPPDNEEQAAMTESLIELTEVWREKLSPKIQHDIEPEIKRRALGNLCHAMMNSAVFLFIE